MVFGKKNKKEIQYYVDQIDRLKEENSSLNARITNQKAELEHYKAFFNNNAKLLEASNRMNIACGDIQDAFDNLIDHAQAIRFPDKNIHQSTDGVLSDDVHSVVTNAEDLSDVKDKEIFEEQNLAGSLSESFEETNALLSPTEVPEIVTDTPQESALPKEDILDHDLGTAVSDNDSNINNVLSSEDPLFETDTAVDDTKNFNSISNGYTTKSEMIAGHVDSLFAIDEQDSDKTEPVSHQSADIQSVDQPSNNDNLFDTNDLFEKDEIVEENVSIDSSTDDIRNNRVFSNDATVLTETEPLRGKPFTVDSDTSTFSSIQDLNTSDNPKYDFSEESASFGDRTSDVSGNVDKLFDEELIPSNENKPASQNIEIESSDLFLNEESLDETHVVTTSAQEAFEVAPIDEEDVSDETKDANHYVFESTPKGQHITFDESFDSSKNEDSKISNETQDAVDVFEIDEISDFEADHTDVFTEVTNLNETSEEMPHQNAQIDGREKSNHISEARARIATIDFHEEINWFKPKRNPRRRNFSHQTQE